MCSFTHVMVLGGIQIQLKSMAVQMLLDGHSLCEVARIANVLQSVVARMWRRYQETGQFTRRPGQGRSRCTTDAVDRYIRLLALRNQRGTLHGSKQNSR